MNKKIVGIFSKNIFENGDIVYRNHNGIIPDEIKNRLEKYQEAFNKIHVRGAVKNMDVYTVDKDGNIDLILNCYVYPGSSTILDNGDALSFIFTQNDSLYPAPNNAAVYNSDGSLRHQLRWTDDLENKHDWYIHSTYYADFPSLKGWGVMVTSDHYNPSLNFYLYDGTSNLIRTGYSQERR
ncbi:UNVERIFIED_CONTAM: hypothetical protein GN151_06080 [Acinetobacter sp. HSTU-ASm16]